MIFHIWSLEIKVSKNENYIKNVINYLEACKAEEQYLQNRFEYMHKVY